MKVRYLLAAATAAGLAATAACGASLQAQTTASTQLAGPQGIHKIKHVIIIMQENRSYDSYFGTFPAPGGIPPGVCVPDPFHHTCVKPHTDHHDKNTGGPHLAQNSAKDTNGGRMDGFIGQAELKCKTGKPCHTDVMGHHVASDIPDYWYYAQHYVLLTKMFESVHSYSLPMHLYMASGWSAKCPVSNPDPMKCTSDDMPPGISKDNETPFHWTSLTYLLNTHRVSWGWYLDNGGSGVLKIWNVMPGFTDNKGTVQTGGVAPLKSFLTRAGSSDPNVHLPAVSWILPDYADSEHPQALVSTGQAYVTKIINAVMRSKDWDSSVIFLAWDDWGGFYDHVPPKKVDQEGYGIRVPGIIISPYAKSAPDNSAVTPDAFMKFIENDFLNGQRIDNSDGRPDARPDVREKFVSDLSNDFDFNQQPRKPTILNPCPPNTTLIPHPGPACNGTGGVSAGEATRSSDD